jgi:hypothetical protein
MGTELTVPPHRVLMAHREGNLIDTHDSLFSLFQSKSNQNISLKNSDLP